MNGSLEVADALRERGRERRGRRTRSGSCGPDATDCASKARSWSSGPDGIFYPPSTPRRPSRSWSGIVEDGDLVEPLLYRDDADAEPIARYADIPFNARQQRIVLRNCGVIDPESIDDALGHGAYGGLSRALDESLSR